MPKGFELGFTQSYGSTGGRGSYSSKLDDEKAEELRRARELREGKGSAVDFTATQRAEINTLVKGGMKRGKAKQKIIDDHGLGPLTGQFTKREKLETRKQRGTSKKSVADAKALILKNKQDAELLKARQGYTTPGGESWFTRSVGQELEKKDADIGYTKAQGEEFAAKAKALEGKEARDQGFYDAMDLDQKKAHAKALTDKLVAETGMEVAQAAAIVQKTLESKTNWTEGGAEYRKLLRANIIAMGAAEAEVKRSEAQKNRADAAYTDTTADEVKKNAESLRKLNSSKGELNKAMGDAETTNAESLSQERKAAAIDATAKTAIDGRRVNILRGTLNLKWKELGNAEASEKKGAAIKKLQGQIFNNFQDSIDNIFEEIGNIEHHENLGVRPEDHLAKLELKARKLRIPNVAVDADPKTVAAAGGKVVSSGAVMAGQMEARRVNLLKAIEVEQERIKTEGGYHLKKERENRDGVIDILRKDAFSGPTGNLSKQLVESWPVEAQQEFDFTLLARYELGKLPNVAFNPNDKYQMSKIYVHTVDPNNLFHRNPDGTAMTEKGENGTEKPIPNLLFDWKGSLDGLRDYITERKAETRTAARRTTSTRKYGEREVIPPHLDPLNLGPRPADPLLEGTEDLTLTGDPAELGSETPRDLLQKSWTAAESRQWLLRVGTSAYDAFLRSQGYKTVSAQDRARITGLTDEEVSRDEPTFPTIENPEFPTLEASDAPATVAPAPAPSTIAPAPEPDWGTGGLSLPATEPTPESFRTIEQLAAATAIIKDAESRKPTQKMLEEKKEEFKAFEKKIRAAQKKGTFSKKQAQEKLDAALEVIDRLEKRLKKVK